MVRARQQNELAAVAVPLVADVLMITVVVVDQVVRRRQASNRCRAAAVQAAIMMTHAPSEAAS